MRVAIAGAGNVGRSIAQELIDNGHQVMLIERQPRMLRPERVPAAEWVLADACELASLQEADVAGCDVVVAATGDDKVNLVVSLLAKTEFAVPRVVARVNRAENEWLFTEQWGVDVSVSKPRLMAALVEEAVTVGDLVRLMTFRQGEANLVEITLPETAPYVGPPGPRGAAAPRLAPWSRSCAASGCWCPPRTTRWRPATSWSSSAPPRSRTRSARSSSARSSRGGSARRGLGSLGAATAGSLARVTRRTVQTVIREQQRVRRVAERQPGDAERDAPCRPRTARAAAPTLANQHDAPEHGQPGEGAHQPGVAAASRSARRRPAPTRSSRPAAGGRPPRRAGPSRSRTPYQMPGR